jgi:hypothetical protein
MITDFFKKLQISLDKFRMLLIIKSNMSGAKTKIVLVILSVILFLFFSMVNGRQTGTPCQPYGSVEFRGASAPDGYKVEALVGETKFAETEIQKGKYDLLIPADDPDTPEKDGWSQGDRITLKVNGYKALPTFEAFEGIKNYDVFVPSLDVKLSTWGKIKALFK